MNGISTTSMLRPYHLPEDRIVVSLGWRGFVKAPPSQLAASLRKAFNTYARAFAAPANAVAVHVENVHTTQAKFALCDALTELRHVQVYACAGIDPYTAVVFAIIAFPELTNVYRIIRRTAFRSGSWRDALPEWAVAEVRQLSDGITDPVLIMHPVTAGQLNTRLIQAFREQRIPVLTSEEVVPGSGIWIAQSNKGEQ